MSRVLVIGLDGASPHLVHRWRKYLPHLSGLLTGGAGGTLTSVTPPRSIPAWYCFVTGMNPAKCGVFGFSQRRSATYDYTFANFSYCQAPPFWDWLNRHGVSAGILHLPGSFPPRPLDGFLVSGWPAPLDRGNLQFTSPPELSCEIHELLKAPFEFLSPIAIRKDTDADALAERLRILSMHGDVAVHLLAKHAWQTALVVLSPLDRASHQFWRHMDPEHPQHVPAEEPGLANALRDIYVASDEQVGRLLELVGNDDWVFVVSDHGFGPNHRIFYVNEWLKRKGYLHLKEDDGKAVGPSLRTQLVGALTAPLIGMNDASPTFRRLIEPLKKRAFSNYLRDHYVRSQEKSLVRLNHLPVDWSTTRVYCPDESSIYLNLRGRDPQGIVESGPEAEALLAELEKELSAIVDPETGEAIPVDIVRKEVIYRGAHLLDAPDLIMSMDNFRTEVMAELGNGQMFDLSPDRNGTHTPEGLLIARGPGIRPGSHVDANLMDIAPTLLHLMGTPIPLETDGRVLLELFDASTPPQQRPVLFESMHLVQDSGAELTQAEQAQVEEQLRGLGYLS